MVLICQSAGMEQNNTESGKKKWSPDFAIWGRPVKIY